MQSPTHHIIGGLCLAWIAMGGAEPAHALVVTQQEWTGGEAEHGRFERERGDEDRGYRRWDRERGGNDRGYGERDGEHDGRQRGYGKHEGERGGQLIRALDRLLGREATLLIEQYQSEIVPSLTTRHVTYSLFTSGLNGAAAPTATISGHTLTVDLTSLFFGISRGDHFRALNIGGMATGFFNPDTLEFCLTWDHLFRGRPMFGLETFSLHGQVVNVAAIPIVTTTVLFCTGLAVLMGVWRRKGVTQRGERVPSA